MLEGAINQEKALVGAFSVIVKTGCGTDGSFYSTIQYTQSRKQPPEECCGCMATVIIISP